jgi:hypothetical protein
MRAFIDEPFHDVLRTAIVGKNSSLSLSPSRGEGMKRP